MGRRHPAQPPPRLELNSQEQGQPADRPRVGANRPLHHGPLLPPHLSFVASLSEPKEAPSPWAGQDLTCLPTSPFTDEETGHFVTQAGNGGIGCGLRGSTIWGPDRGFGPKVGRQPAWAGRRRLLSAACPRHLWSWGVRGAALMTPSPPGGSEARVAPLLRDGSGSGPGEGQSLWKAPPETPSSESHGRPGGRSPCGAGAWLALGLSEPLLSGVQRTQVATQSCRTPRPRPRGLHPEGPTGRPAARAQRGSAGPWA